MIKVVIVAVIGFFWGVWCTQSAYERSGDKIK
jgi:hypothetical protein